MELKLQQHIQKMIIVKQYLWIWLEVQVYLGLKGIQAKRDNIYIRPLIESSRNEIEEYCEQNSLEPRHDKTNDENIYSRNIEEETRKTFSELLIKREKEEIILNLKEFNKKHKCIKSRLIIYTIKILLGNTNGIEKIHIEDIIELCQNNIGNKYLTPNKNLKIMVNKGKMYFFVTKKT